MDYRHLPRILYLFTCCEDFAHQVCSLGGGSYRPSRLLLPGFLLRLSGTGGPETIAPAWPMVLPSGSEACYLTNDGLGHVCLDVLGAPQRHTDLTNHDDVSVSGSAESFQSVDVGGADDAVATNTDSGG